MRASDLPSARPATLADVARAAGVSSATASRALAGASTPVVSEATRRRVEEAAASLGYRMNTAARDVARGYTDTVAVLVEDVREPESSSLARGAINEASERGLTVTVAGAGGDRTRLVRTLRAIREQQPRAVMIGASAFEAFGSPAAEAELTAFEKQGGRTLFVGNADLPFTDLAIDEGPAIAELANQLRTSGYREGLLLVRGDRMKHRARAVTAAFEDHGIAIRHISVGEGDTGLADVVEAIRAEPTHPRLLACTDLATTFAAYRGIRAAGFRVGVDIAVTGFGWKAAVEDLTPSLTTIAVPAEEIGAHALRVVLSGGGASAAPVATLILGDSAPTR